MGELFGPSTYEYAEFALMEVKFWAKCVRRFSTDFDDKPNFDEWNKLRKVRKARRLMPGDEEPRVAMSELSHGRSYSRTTNEVSPHRVESM